MGEQLAARKQDLEAEYKRSGIPTPKLTTMDETSI